MQIQDTEHTDGHEITTQERQIQDSIEKPQFKVLSKEELSKLTLAEQL